MKYDIIIIGSGIGGLTCASMLSSLNKKVLLLEKNENPGGCLQTITKENRSWSLGMQYVCKYGKTSIYNILLQIVTDNGVKFSKLDAEFQYIDFYKEADKLRKKEFTYPIIADTKLMRAKLISDFPDDKRKIKKYYRYLNRINRKVLTLPLAKFFPFCFAKFIYPVILAIAFPIMSITLFRLHKISIKKVVEDKLKITNQHLRDIIYSNYHFTGMPIDKSPFLFWAVAQKMVEGGIYYPNGGSKSIVDAFLYTIKKNGGEIECNKEVKSIIIENNKSVGVELTDGTKFKSKKVISNAGIAETISKMIPEEKQNNQVKILNKIAFKEIPSSNSEIVLRVGLEGDLSEFNIQKSTYRYVIGNSSEMIGDPTKKDWLPPDLTYSFFTMYDDSYKKKNSQNVDILQPTKFSYFKDLKYKSKEYCEVVDNITEIMLNKFDERFPGIKKLVKYTTITTPLSVENKTSHIKGSIYGRNIKKAGIPIIQARTGIKNLYFTGEDVFSQGITVFNGILTSIVVGGFFRTIIAMFKKWRTF